MSEHKQAQQSKKKDSTFQRQSTLTIQNPVSHPASIIQRARINPKSLTPADVLQLQRTIGNRAVGKLLSEIRNQSKVQQAPIQRQKLEREEICSSCMQRQEIPEEEPLQGKMIETVQRQEIPEEEEPLQGKFETIQRFEPEEEDKLQMKSVVQRQEIPEEEEPIQGKMIGTVQRQEIPEEEEPLHKKSENNTGMPDNLKAGVESLSGIDMSDVRVHYNSSKPAEVGALAYTQGTNIHVAPGQERHLPHEAWHVVQQVQGRVKPTVQLRGMAANDDMGMEREADELGSMAKSTTAHELKTESHTESNIIQRTLQTWGNTGSNPETYNKINPLAQRVDDVTKEKFEYVLEKLNLGINRADFIPPLTEERVTSWINSLTKPYAAATRNAITGSVIEELVNSVFREKKHYLLQKKIEEARLDYMIEKDGFSGLLDLTSEGDKGHVMRKRFTTSRYKYIAESIYPAIDFGDTSHIKIDSAALKDADTVNKINANQSLTTEKKHITAALEGARVYFTGDPDSLSIIESTLSLLATTPGKYLKEKDQIDENIGKINSKLNEKSAGYQITTLAQLINYLKDHYSLTTEPPWA